MLVYYVVGLLLSKKGEVIVVALKLPLVRGRRSEGKSLLELNPGLQEEICAGIRRGATLKSIFDKLNIAHTNYYAWYNRGKKELRGIYRDFYNAVEQAKVERWEGQKPKLEKVVYKSATEMREVVNRRIERIMILSRDDKLLLEEKFEESDELRALFEKDGIILKETTTVIQIVPHVPTAMRILERKSPDEWGKQS